MPATLTPDVIALLDSAETVKVLATVDANGAPDAVEKPSLHHGGDGTIHVLEFLETSAANRNLTHTIWYGGSISVALHGADGHRVQIKGRPVKLHITGPLFQQHYVRARETLGDVDLAGVWVIEPDEVIDERFEKVRAREDAAHPDFIHLDRIAV
ncbi:hypothetical protein T281_04965 [Rhodomicrobium udaipurense JA643]|uniref:Pyridoxamine 5'-phosphate oxidase n=1 Tax=Rhodomicrobium udaipurense TaxID=1202716 RepID=A0A8I1GG99_9HYPH|nr:hypothetical protein [Rhodomicrobium udaipurense]KAI95535.1 hypothetical protein T281_04965 [Rhodomicrobium udaipurense JA643]MBJ7542795.1 hypothetical protein [Rhodomicrobium udaipurense]